MALQGTVGMNINRYSSSNVGVNRTTKLEIVQWSTFVEGSRAYKRNINGGGTWCPYASGKRLYRTSLYFEVTKFAPPGKPPRLPKCGNTLAQKPQDPPAPLRLPCQCPARNAGSGVGPNQSARRSDRARYRFIFFPHRLPCQAHAQLQFELLRCNVDK